MRAIRIYEICHGYKGNHDVFDIKIWLILRLGRFLTLKGCAKKYANIKMTSFLMLDVILTLKWPQSDDKIMRGEAGWARTLNKF